MRKGFLIMKGIKIYCETIGNRKLDYVVIYNKKIKDAIEEFQEIDFDGIKYTECAIVKIEIIII